MFDFPQSGTALNRFAQTHDQSVQHAALLLGGSPWLRRAQRLLQDLGQSQPVQRRTIREAAALLSLFRLENVHVEDSIDETCFAELDPEGPYVEEICLLTDTLADALSDMGEATDVWGDQQEEHWV